MEVLILKKLCDAVDRFCLNHPRFGIPGLMRYVVLLTAAVFLLDAFSQNTASAILYFDADAILHGGDIRLLDFEDGVVRFELLGQCAGCPAASLTTEQLIRTALTEELPEVRDAVLVEHVDEDLIAQKGAYYRLYTGAFELE